MCEVVGCQSSTFAAIREPGWGHYMSSGGVASGRQVQGVSFLLGRDHLGPVGIRHSSRGYSIKMLHILPFMGVWNTRSPTLCNDVLSGEVTGLL